MRFAVDTGGTFTDLVIEDGDGRLTIHKSSTIVADPVVGILDVFDVAAAARGTTARELLGGADVLIHGTTRGLNAVLTDSVATTALLTTDGHRDILLLREGGRTDVFDLRRPYPDPYIPRSLTFEVPERIGYGGEVVRALDEAPVLDIVARLRELQVEAVAVALLWSIANPAHELRVGELLEEHLPGVPFTLSHELNPCIREYRRASAAAIDASLKPIMSDYIGGLTERLGEAGFGGRLLMVTSSGGALDANDVAAAPIHSLRSGPSMAPVAGRYFARQDAESELGLVADTGGTSYDVSLVRRGRIPWTRETWLGQPYFGHMTGLPSVDVHSVGAGGGSIARVDAGGLLHVGPDSAGADPGPACYGLGGEQPTTTDACLVLGYIDPRYFLGGRTRLDLDAAVKAVRRHVGEPLGLDDHEAAAAILGVATERMVGAIEAITIHAGIDPRDAVLVGGGGAAGLNSVAIARRLGCREVIIPSLGPAISAAGALISDLSRTFEITHPARSASFDYEGVADVLADLERRARAFIDGPGAGALESAIEYSVEARYPHQVWELDVAMTGGTIETEDDLRLLCERFHAVHQEVFAVSDPASPVEFEGWHARARCKLSEIAPPEAVHEPGDPSRRSVYFSDTGTIEADVWRLGNVPADRWLEGPAIVATATTTVVIDAAASFERHSNGTIRILPGSPNGD